MDFGLRNRRALVCGASKGLGFACAQALAAEGVQVTLVARTPAEIEGAAGRINQLYPGKAIGLAADVSNAEGRAAMLEAAAAPDIVVTNAGGPPPGDFRNFDRSAWIAALEQNLLSAVELIRDTIDPMISRGFGRIVNITSGAVKAPIPALPLSNAARAGLTGFVSGLARDVAAHNVTINNLLPGQFDTDRMKSAHSAFAAARGMKTDAFREAAVAQIPARRFGDPAEFGQFCAFLCSAQAGYLTGQNILLDGGQFPGLL